MLTPWGWDRHNWPFSQLTHHRLKATIDNCLTAENSADCNFSPESFLSLEKFEIAFVNDYDDDL